MVIRQKVTNNRRFNWVCVAAVNDERIFAANLAASPALTINPSQLKVERGHPTAGAAYNSGLEATDAPVIVFAHQDVYLPRGWGKTMCDGLMQLEEIDPSWGVAGLVGVLRGKRITEGRAWSSGLGRELGRPFLTPRPVGSLDEFVLILRRNSGLRFDEALPGFHLYGTDIVQTALTRGLGAWLIHAPAIHNSVPVATFAGDFLNAYGYMQRKWRHALPITTPVTRITSSGLYHWGRRLRHVMERPAALERVNALHDRRAGKPDPALLARELKFESCEGAE